MAYQIYSKQLRLSKKHIMSKSHICLQIITLVPAFNEKPLQTLHSHSETALKTSNILYEWLKRTSSAKLSIRYLFKAEERAMIKNRYSLCNVKTNQYRRHTSKWDLQNAKRSALSQKMASRLWTKRQRLDTIIVNHYSIIALEVCCLLSTAT